jgi:hypothetical protein
MKGFGIGEVTRRGFAAGIAGAAALAAGMAGAGEVIKEISKLKPGEFTWHPERQRTGPVAVIVSLAEQRVHVYRNGIRIAVSTCSTGKPGHETPTGVFVVLEKDADHHSNLYDDAAMPNMNRLTWSGIALHAGKLPGYPASHGCVRLPMDFSARLFSITHIGTPVIIADQASDPRELVHPGMVLAAYSSQQFGAAIASLKQKDRPNDWTDIQTAPIVSVIASSKDKTIMLVENSTVAAIGSLTVKGWGKLGSHVYVLDRVEGSASLRWLAISHATGGESVDRDPAVITRLTADPAFVSRMQKSLHPGAMLILTDMPLSPDSRSGKDFAILSS